VSKPAELPPPGSPAAAEAESAALRHVVGAMPGGVVIADAAGRLRYANAAAIRLWGYADPAEVPELLEESGEPQGPGGSGGPQGGPPVGRVPEGREGPAAALDVRDVAGAPIPRERWPLARALAGERFEDFDCVLLGRDGVRRWVRCYGGPVELEGGERGGWVNARDVGREELILRELREERDLVTALIDASPIAVAVARAPDMMVELVNDVARALRPETQMVGRRFAEVFPGAGPAGFLDTLDRVAATGEPFSVTDAPIDWLGPETRYFSITLSRLPQPLERPTRVLIMARETTAEVAARTRAEAVATERTRDLSRARVTSARLRSLVDLAAAIGSVEDLDALLHLVTGEAARLLGSDMASLFLLEERGDVLLGRAHVGMADDVVAGMRIVLAEWPEVSEVLRTGRPAVHTRADQVRGPERPYIERFGIRSYLAVRLGSPSRPLGVLFVNYADRRHRFTRPELAFVETLTSYLSVTIERARLVNVLREAVTSLQAAVLPASFPMVPGLDVGALYRSASEVAQVGGDFYDLFALEGGRVAAVIGDVCGKGVAAARHTMRLRYELRTLLEEGKPPGRTLGSFNHQVLDEIAEDEYVTMLLLVLDPATGAVSWSSAGHPPPVLACPGPRVLTFDGSLPLGMFPDATYRTARLRLQPGRCLVLYTDGVIEARNLDGQELGAEGLEAAVPPMAASAAAVAEAILKQVQSHTGDHLDDDAAVLVLRRE
jgi:serine phosphatase RsbU (regulator of sigma subunit)/PAS domain-containing protein